MSNSAMAAIEEVYPAPSIDGIELSEDLGITDYLENY